MGLSTKDVKKLAKASALSHSDDPKDQDRARARQTEVDYKDLVRQLKAKRKKKMKESFEIDKSAHKKVQKKAKLRNLAKGNTNPNEKAAAEKKAGGPKLIGEGEIADKLRKAIADMKAADRKAGLLPGGKDVIDLDVERERRRKKKIKEGKTWDSWKKAAAKALGRKEKERKAEKAHDAGARAKRKLQRREYASKVSGSEDNVPDEMRD